MTAIPHDVDSQDVSSSSADVVTEPRRESTSEGAPAWLTGYLTEYWLAHPEGTEVPAGAVALHALQGPTGDGTEYIDVPLPPDDLATWGPPRSVRDHLLLLRRRWDATEPSKITAVRVVLGLALDPELGRPLLDAGAVESVVRLWKPQARRGPEPTLLPWDLLSDQGRDEAEAQPLLAAALGAPSEWNGGKRIRLPGTPTSVAFSPSADRLAVLCGTDVYRVTRDGAVDRVAAAPDRARAIGWSRSGIVALTLDKGVLTLSDVDTGAVLETRGGVLDGLVSGDGSTIWVAESQTVTVVHVGEPDPTQVSVHADRVLAVSHDGRLATLTAPASEHVISLDPETLLPGMEASGAAAGPQRLIMPLSSDALGSDVRAIGRLGPRVGRARPGEDGGVVVESLTGTPVARIASGPGEVTAVAAGPGDRLAVGTDDGLGVWSIGSAPPVEVRPQYAPDRAAAPADLLDVDRDAQAFAALIASADLTPPLAIGLFGAWGSGKSFFLERIATFIGAYRKDGRASGYLEHVPVVRFNAWHYAETNLWAALVNEVLDAVRKECSPAWEADEKVRAAEQALADARLEVWRRRRKALLAAAAAAAVVAVGVVLWRTGLARWLWALGLIAVLGSVADAMRSAGSWLKDVGPLFSAIGNVWGASRRLTEARLEAALERKRQPSEVRKAEELGGTIRKLVEEPEYRDLLGLVTRTRERFKSLDETVRLGRENPAENAALQLDRVVVMIDDLDRCPPEKVVTVLEAVHLLFDFELFVVLLAVDTRWLEQSLRIRYRQLLGGGAAASASDYLEKIIQVPRQVAPLDREMVRRMLSGLAGVSLAPDPAVAGPVPDGHAPGNAAQHVGGNDTREGKAARHGRPVAQALQLTAADAAAMSAVAPLVGTTPRTVKRFVNTYRLLKARADDLASFSQPQGGVADHEIVAFLLALVTGRPALTPLLAILGEGKPQTSVRSGLDELIGPEPDTSAAEVIAWLDGHPVVAAASAARCSRWAQEVGRFTFVPRTA